MEDQEEETRVLEGSDTTSNSLSPAPAQSRNRRQADLSSFLISAAGHAATETRGESQASETTKSKEKI